jgi:RNA polymerase sigma-70 factor (ECF subfamily)
MVVIVLPDIPAEDRLLARAQRGDDAAILQIYESYFSPIYSYIRLRVGDLATAEDLASDVFVKMVNAFKGRNAPRHSLRGWLFKVARNTIYTHYGKVKRFPKTTLEDWIPDEASDDLEVRFIRAVGAERARRALGMLAPDQQEVLILRFGQMLDLEETADVMGKSIGAVKSLQFRAVNTLRGILGEMQVEHE